jgi:hypothetical protein
MEGAECDVRHALAAQNGRQDPNVRDPMASDARP